MSKISNILHTVLLTQSLSQMTSNIWFVACQMADFLSMLCQTHISSLRKFKTHHHLLSIYLPQRIYSFLQQEGQIIKSESTNRKINNFSWTKQLMLGSAFISLSWRRRTCLFVETQLNCFSTKMMDKTTYKMKFWMEAIHTIKKW